MGQHLSIDKYTTHLDDWLGISPSCFKKVDLKNVVSQTITQHLKIWRFSVNDRHKIETNPVSLHNLEQTGFIFSSVEAYLVLLVYRANTTEKVDVVSFPHSLWGLVESADNLTPRGLSNSISSDEDSTTVQSLDSFLLSKREHKDSSKNKQFKYMLFVWNGKEANALLKACALSRGFELDTLLNKSGDWVLSFIFNGGVVRGTRLQRGKVLVFDHASSEQENEEVNDNPNTPETERVIKTFETVYLFQWLVPDNYLQNLKNQSNSSQTSNQKSVIEQTMYPKFRKYFFPSSDEDIQVSNKESEMNDYHKRFKWIENSHSDMAEENATPDERYRNDERLPPQSNPIPKLAFPKDLGSFQQPAQKPAIPLLNIAAQEPQEKEESRENFEPNNRMKVPNIKGIALDMNQVSRKYNYEDYDMSSSDRIYEESGEMSSSRASNPEKKGISLDLTKAKAIQNEMLNQNAGGNRLIPSLGLPGNHDKKVASLAIPVSSGSRSNEDDLSHRMEYEQSTGPQLKINIKNVAKLKEDVHMKEEEDIYEPPQHKRGRAQPDPPVTDVIGYDHKDNPDFMMKDTSVVEARNDKFKQICSEIIPDFLYLGSDFLAKDKEILKKHGITHIINSAGDYSPNYHEGEFKYLTFHLKDHPRENIE